MITLTAKQHQILARLLILNLEACTGSLNSSQNYSPFSMVPETKQRVPKTTHWVPETNPLVHGNEPLGNVSVLFLAFGLFVIVHCMYT